MTAYMDYAQKLAELSKEDDVTHVLDFLEHGEPASIIADDAAALIQRAVNVMRAGSNNRLIKLTGGGLWYNVNESGIDLTNITGRMWGLVDLNIRARCVGKIVADCTGSRFGTFDNVHVQGVPGSEPSIGFLFARNSSGVSAGDHTIGKIETSLNFSVAGVVFHGSEVNACDVLRLSNNYHSRGAACIIVTGNPSTIENFTGSAISSEYATISTGERAQSTLHVRYANYQRGVAYTYTILGITKANPAVVSIAPADAAAASASFGLENGARIFIRDTLTGSNNAWRDLLRSKAFEIANLNVGAGTFELVGVDTTSTTGTFTSGTLSNDSGPCMVLGRSPLYREESGYKVAHSNAKILLDARNDSTDSERNQQIICRAEPAGPYFIEVVGDTTAGRTIRNLTMEDDNSAASVSPILISGCSGDGDITFADLQFRIGNAAQTPARLVTGAEFCKIHGGRIVAPSTAFLQPQSDFKGSECTVEWAIGPNKIVYLPTSDPGIAGAWWYDSGALTVSGGPP